MTSERLQRANKLSEKIKKLETFQEAFNNGYVNYIKAETEKEAEWIYVHSGDELHNLINGFIDKLIRKLKTEFENL